MKNINLVSVLIFLILSSTSVFAQYKDNQQKKDTTKNQFIDGKKLVFENKTLKLSLAKYKENKACAISYTFDDGLKEHYTIVAPELEKRGFRGTFWINGNTINRNQPVVTDTTRMTWAELKELAMRGEEISNHGWAHRKLTKLSVADMRVEIEKNDSAILANTGIKPLTYCYANNAKNDTVVQFASLGRVGTRTFQRSIGSKSTSQDLEEWVEKLIDERDWGVGMTHGINYGYDAFKNPQILWEHLDKVKAMEDKIWIGTFKEVSAYINEAKDITFTIKAKKNSLTIIPILNLNKKLFTEPLTMILELNQSQKISVKQGSRKINVKNIAQDKILFNFDPNGNPIQIKY